ncbi:MAG: hypothetical protein HXK65_00450 [Clostridiales bacterium]|nr:hypothetical protein [Clostridiales bacterium]
MSNMNTKNIMIMAIVLMMALLSTPAMAAGNVQSKVQADTAVETTVANKYPKSMQKKVVEAIDAGKEFGIAEEKRIQKQISTLKDNSVVVDETGIVWKSGKGQNVEKVRVTSGKIHFEWMPSYMGYTWMSDLSMWSEGKLPGREAKLEFLDKEGKVLWSTNVTFKKKVQAIDSGNTEEIVPPCPNDMAPTSAPAEAVQIGVAPGAKK